MPIAQPLLVKAITGVAAAITFVGGATVVTVIRGDGPGRERHPVAGAHERVAGQSFGLDDADVVVDPATGTVRLVPRVDADGAGAAGGASANAKALTSSPGSSRLPGVANASRSGVGGQPAFVAARGSTGPSGSGGSAGGTATVPGGSGGSGATPPPGGSGGSTPIPVPELAAPTVPAAPAGATAHSEGTFTVSVPGNERQTKELCLSGTAVNKCRPVTVPAVKPVDVTISYSGSAGTEAPKVSPGSCPGGASLTVSGLTPGATVTVTVNGKTVTSTVPEGSPNQTASLCDA